MHATLVTLFFALTPPTISRVVVYPDRAQVTRSAKITCDARTVVTFSALPPGADPPSFRARVSAGTVEGLRYEQRTRREAYAPEVAQIDAELRKLQLDRAAITDGNTRAGKGRDLSQNLLDVSVAMIGREAVDGALLGAKSWASGLEQVLAARLKASDGDVDRAAKLRDLDRKIADLRTKRARSAAAGEGREYVAEVLVSCPEGRTVDVELNYMVGGASWTAAYEARADEAKGEVELSTYATVAQATGEDWKGVEVVLSTAIPRENATPPEIQPLKVWAEERKAEKKVLVRRDEAQQHAEASGEQANMDGTKDTGGAEGGGGLKVRAQGLSVQMAVPEQSDVLGDGSPARLLVGRSHMKAQFAYKSIPKLAPFVFRTADLVNTAPLPLLPGMLDAFRKNGMLGRYGLERVAEGARFQLTFGIEESMRVKRLTVEEIVRDRGFLGSTRRFRFAYRIEVANYQEGAQTVELSEHIPVSELEDVKVQMDPKTTAGYESKPDDGIVTWKVKLNPGEKKLIDLVYAVDVPSSYDTGGL